MQSVRDAIDELQLLCSDNCGSDKEDKLEILERHVHGLELLKALDAMHPDLLRYLRKVGTIRTVDVKTDQRKMDVTSHNDDYIQFIPVGPVEFTMTIKGWMVP